MKIIYLRGANKNIFDVFFGDGWKTWARFRQTRNTINQIKGIPVNSNVVSIIQKEIKCYTQP